MVRVGGECGSEDGSEGGSLVPHTPLRKSTITLHRWRP